MRWFSCHGHKFNNVEKIMSNEKLNRQFGEMVQKCLCGESYWFLNDVSAGFITTGLTTAYIRASETHF